MSCPVLPRNRFRSIREGSDPWSIPIIGMCKVTQVRRMAIANTMLAGPGTEGTDQYRKNIEDMTKKRDELEAQLARQIPEMRLDR